MNEIWKNDKKPNFEPDFGPFGPYFDSQTFFVSFTSTNI